MSNKIIGEIERGIVIDHLLPGEVWKVAHLLNLNSHSGGRISLGDHYESYKSPINSKSFVKIEGRDLTDYELNLIALVSPNATISFIESGGVSQKAKAHIPKVLLKVLPCSNSNCITNKTSEKIDSRIYYEDQVFTCHYCSHTFLKKDLKI